MVIPKQPGWGLRILKVRSTNGTPEALILPPDHEAPFWTDLRQIAQHKARTIYESVIPSTK
jgi:predicted DNA-binding ribbon-helix-helix protein